MRFEVGCITLTRMRICLSDFLPEGVVVSAEDAALLMQASRALEAEDEIYQRDADAAEDGQGCGESQEW